MSKKVLLAGDVDAIKEFVFETSSLPQVRGGSELLLECEEEIRGELQKQYGYEVIYCCGGSFLLEAPADRVGQIRWGIERLYLERTLTATVTLVHEDCLPVGLASAPEDGWAGRLCRAVQGVSPDGEFAHRMFFLNARMRQAKNQRADAPFYEAFSFGRRCDRCGKRMAAHPEPAEPKKLLCSVCEKRDSRGRQRDAEIRGKFNRELWNKYQGNGYCAKQPQDLDTLVESAKRKYLAFLYADGNDIGSLLQREQDPQRYRTLSNDLAEGTKAALFGAIAEICGDTLQAQEYWPFDIINIGGDDVTMLIQAGYAWAVAVGFLKRFEEEVNGRLKRSLGSSSYPDVTAACGIVIADVKYPMRYFERLGSDLVKEAKRLAKKDPDDPKSAVTFLWLPSPVASEKVEPLMGFYSRPLARDCRCELTARPYDLEQASEILSACQSIGRWPRTLRHRWAEALERGVMASVNLIHYDIARRRQREEIYQTLVRVGRLAAPDADHTDIPAPIWYQVRKDRETVWRTALLDALELAELQVTRPDGEEETE
ncbi:MAG: Cas10/Cmr2 second palm domain-containing protein [Anaerolineae bacterium]